jgi:arylsulfatase
MRRRCVGAWATAGLALSLLLAAAGPGPAYSAEIEIPAAATNLATAIVDGQPSSLGAEGVNSYDVLPPVVPPAWKGKIGQRVSESRPFWPKEMTPPKGAPNVLMILIDDAGFGVTSPFGGPVPTPTFEALANRGLRYTKFHTTALCSPTRAALLTGRNHHSVHSGTITETGSGYPGYNTLMEKDTASVAEIMKLAGYNTAWIGKNHNVPDWQSSMSGPFDLWPTGLGFEYFKGFIGGDTSQWRPALYEGTKPIEPYLDNPNYILNSDLANSTIRYIEQQHALAPEKPFFVYYAPGATHAPHHVPKEWIAKFKGQFDHGWDEQRKRTFAKQKEMGIFPADAKLTDRPESIPAYGDSTDDQKKVYARMMEV